MKYQIYLNKETSEFIEKASAQEGIKSATLIKHIVEDITHITMATQRELEASFFKPRKEQKQ